MKKRLRKSEIRELNESLNQYSYQADKKDLVEILEESSLKLVLINSRPLFFYRRVPVPTLKFLIEHPVLKKVVVDMGAVKFVVSGADIMRPGIVEIDSEIEDGQHVMIVDQNNMKPLAVGTALYNAEEIRSMSSGRVVRNLHYVGDSIWNYET